MEDRERLDVINHLRKIVDEKHAANIKSETVKITASKLYSDDIAIIIGTLTKDNEYINNNFEGDYFILKNPTHRINQSLIAANTSSILTGNSVRSLNTFQKRILWASIFIAAVTTAFIILTYLKQRNDKSQEQLKELVQKEQEILKTLQGIQSSLKEINSSIEKLKMDSLSVRLKKK